MSYTGLNSHQAYRVVSSLDGRDAYVYKSPGWQHLFSQGVELLGELGYFNLKE